MNEMTTTKRQRRQFSAEERARWVDLFERSGKSVREFCRENAAGAVGPPSLSRWLRQRHAGSGRRRREGSLVEVRVAPAPATAAVAMRVSLPGGVTMEVTSGADAAWLAGVLRALCAAQG